MQIAARCRLEFENFAIRISQVRLRLKLRAHASFTAVTFASLFKATQNRRFKTGSMSFENL